MKREPVLIITTIATILIGAIATLTGNGFISDVAAGKATDVVNALVQLLVLLAPVIAGILARGQVTPVAAPSLPVGTPVLVQGTGDTPPPDAVVAVRAPANRAASASHPVHRTHV